MTLIDWLYRKKKEIEIKFNKKDMVLFIENQITNITICDIIFYK